MENLKSTLFKFKGYYFSRLGLKLDLVENLEDFEIRDDDVFIVTYPKSGTIWFQQILSLIYSEEHRKRTGNRSTVDQVPFMEYNFRKKNIVKRPSPRLFVTHLPYYLFPSGMQNNKAKIIYIYRNPKDVLCSYFYFFKNVALQLTGSFDELFEQFLEGKVIGSLWFDHIKGWYEHKSLFNIQFMIYEEMKKNFRGSIVKVCKYLGKELIDEDMDAVVTQAMFENMKSDPRANYDSIMEIVGIPTNGHFLRKGTIGDWKNHMTVEQNERFDKIFQREMKDFPLKFIWDMNEE
ncbi:amine sulfotransferase-like [Suricata suricatta]|uniref:amine sulfotransferase-like n=1 Tax=Suricata suricatta TaxID=37032 RepID=UPI001155FF83|nr:amine sulfotransferase-like [Suricata suricatta]